MRPLLGQVGSLLSQALEAKFVDPTRSPEWDQLVSRHPDFSFFHSAAWMRALCKTYGHKPMSLHCSRHGEPMALVPLLEVKSPFTGRRGVSLPFTDYCSPLLFGEFSSEIVLEKLCDLARERHWKYFELRGGKASRVSAGPSVAFYGHTLDLSGGPERLFAALAASVRRAVRKAERSELNVQVSQSQEAILEFYRLHVRTRRRHGLPPQPKSFFLSIHNEIIKQGSGFVVLARRRSIPVAAAVFLHMGTKAVYKFGASDERHQDLRGNNLVMWEAIQFLAQNGFDTLHLGRTSFGNEGLRRFKLCLGHSGRDDQLLPV